MKKKILSVAVVIILVTTAAYGTLAYFTHEDTATNVITAGEVKMKLEELAETPDGTLVPFENEVDVMPGMSVSKIVQIKNVGGQVAWVRICVEKAIIPAEGVTEELDAALITYNLNTEYWTERDGYYYYNTELPAGKTTEPLFTEVTFSAEMSNLYQHSKALIQVKAQATQKANNGSSVWEAAGWPSEE